LIVGLNRASKRRNWNSTVVTIDANIPEADLLKPDDETLHGREVLENYPGVFKLFALIVKSEGERVYACVKMEEDESDKWTVYTMDYM